MATKLFGAEFAPGFGTVGRSLFALFQLMTLESWSTGIVRPVMDLYPYAWVFFVAFILITTFAVLNLFIAIIVNSMHNPAQPDEDEAKESWQGQVPENLTGWEHREKRDKMAEKFVPAVSADDGSRPDIIDECAARIGQLAEAAA